MLSECLVMSMVQVLRIHTHCEELLLQSVVMGQGPMMANPSWWRHHDMGSMMSLDRAQICTLNFIDVTNLTDRLLLL